MINLKKVALCTLLGTTLISPVLNARDQKAKKTHIKTQEDDQELDLDSTDMVFIIVTALAATSVLGYIIYWKYYRAPTPEKTETPPAKTPTAESKKPANKQKKEQGEPEKPNKQASNKQSGTLPKFAKNINKFWKDQKRFLRKR